MTSTNAQQKRGGLIEPAELKFSAAFEVNRGPVSCRVDKAKNWLGVECKPKFLLTYSPLLIHLPPNVFYDG